MLFRDFSRPLGNFFVFYFILFYFHFAGAEERRTVSKKLRNFFSHVGRIQFVRSEKGRRVIGLSNILKLVFTVAIEIYKTQVESAH